MAITGCEELKGPRPNNGLFMARLQDCKPGDIPACENFKPGETPAAVVYHRPGQTVTVRVSSLDSGSIFFNETLYLPRDRMTNWWAIKGLIGGSYTAELLSGNALLQSCLFNVAGAPAKKRR
jgi:hypothetical protein